MVVIEYRRYATGDEDRCLELFDANCPRFFAPNERDDYLQFLRSAHEYYRVCIVEGQTVGAFGVAPESDTVAALCWILLEPLSQGQGIGAKIMNFVDSTAREQGLTLVRIAASHKSAPFFSRYGAREIDYLQDGWGPGIHRVNMELRP